jgi:hypothetical protein
MKEATKLFDLKAGENCFFESVFNPCFICGRNYESTR